MPIYEFYCDECNTIFNFFSRSVNTTKQPDCPKCKGKKLVRKPSIFATTKGSGQEAEPDEDLPIDAGKMERAMELLGSEADRIDPDNPKQAADLMRKLSNMTGLELGAGMEEALRRMEKGEDPEQIEAEMGDLLESEEPFIISGKGGATGRRKRPAPKTDDTLYEL